MSSQYQKPGAGFRKYYNEKTINIKYNANYRKYFNYTNDGIPDLDSKINIAGLTGHQGWRKIEVKEWIPLLKDKVNNK